MSTFSASVVVVIVIFLMFVAAVDDHMSTFSAGFVVVIVVFIFCFSCSLIALFIDMSFYNLNSLKQNYMKE